MGLRRLTAFQTDGSLLGRFRFYLVLFAGLALNFSSTSTAEEPAPPIEQLVLYVPAVAGGGFDLTARAMRDALLAENLVEKIDIVYSPGAGGLIGLAQFVEAKRGDSTSLLVGGMTMIGAVSSNRAAVSLLDTRPMARLTSESIAVAVPANSPFNTMDSLLEAMLSDPSEISWVGGSIGSVDELLLRDLARILSIPQDKILYKAFPGGGEVSDALSDAQFTAGVNGFSEFEPFVLEGRLRVLALSSEERLAGVSVPTLRELGIDLDLMNWRGVFAAPGISVEEYRRLALLLERMVRSVRWQELLLKHHWQDAYIGGLDFEKYVDLAHAAAIRNEAARTLTVLEASSAISRILSRRYLWALYAATAVLLLTSVVLFQRRRTARLREELDLTMAAAEYNAHELEKALASATTHIQSEFARWHLTDAEQDVGFLMLKGLRLRIVAEMRGTSERTVRQQARSIYRKAGLKGRANLSAYFLEDFFAPARIGTTGDKRVRF